MNQYPLVSVLMAVYNSERYLVQAVESILNQTYQNFEFVIIDDGSRDRSLKILQRYAAKDARIRLISRENRGIPKTRNELLANSNGEFIAVMDADDIARRDRLMVQVNFLQQHPEVVCVGSIQDWIDEAGRFLGQPPVPETNTEIQRLMLQGQCLINNPSTMMRRVAVMQVGGYDETLAQAEDVDLFLKLGEIGELANLPQALVQYRQRTDSITGTHQFRAIALVRQACEQAWQRRGIQGQFCADKPWRPYDRPTLHAYLLHYGWQFFNQGDRFASLSYGWRAVTTLPFDKEGWRLFVCALIKRLPEPTPS